MSYTFTKTVDLPFDKAIEATTSALAAHGFGVLTTIDVKATMKKKLDQDMAPYTILGACNPKMAWQALSHEPHIGTMLPCNVIVRETAEGAIEVAAVDPIESMSAVDNAELGKVAGEVRSMLQKVVDSL